MCNDISHCLCNDRVHLLCNKSNHCMCYNGVILCVIIVVICMWYDVSN